MQKRNGQLTVAEAVKPGTRIVCEEFQDKRPRRVCRVRGRAGRNGSDPAGRFVEFLVVLNGVPQWVPVRQLHPVLVRKK